MTASLQVMAKRKWKVRKVLLSKVLLAWVDEEKDRLIFLCGGQLLRGEERVGQLLVDTVLVRYRGILICHAGCL